MRSSNSPLYLLPATMPERSNTTRRLSFTVSGTIPITMRCASPSTMAVLPTPGSPVRHALFFVRLLRIWISLVISLSRPITGSSFPSAASCVRSRLYWSSVGVLVTFLFPAFLAYWNSSAMVSLSNPIAVRIAANNFWIFTPIVKSSLVATQSVSFRSESNRCSVPQRHSILSASSFACSMILLALGLYWGSFVSAAAVLPWTGVTRLLISSLSFSSSTLNSCSTFPAVPSGSFKRPARRCSVPIYPCPQVFAVVFANLRAFSACLVNCLSMSSPICFHHIRQKYFLQFLLVSLPL